VVRKTRTVSTQPSPSEPARAARLAELCELVSHEEDGERLVELVRELLTLLPEDPGEALVLIRQSKPGRRITDADLEAMT